MTEEDDDDYDYEDFRDSFPGGMPTGCRNISYGITNAALWFLP